MLRRDLLRAVSGLLTGVLFGGCEFASSRQPRPEKITSRLIDVHSHIFNGSDLPTVRFIKIVMLHQYPRQAIRTLDIENADAVDGMIAVLTAILGRTSAPTAREERELLDKLAPPRALNARTPENEAAVLEAIEGALVRAEDRAKSNDVAVADGLSPEMARRLVDAFSAAAGDNEVPVDGRPRRPSTPRERAERAFRSRADIGQYLRWFALFTQYRHLLAEELADTHRQQGFDAVLLCPAVIDYDFWLGEFLRDRRPRARVSPLDDQVAVMGRLARRTSGPVVHGYVSFDPLRQAYFDSPGKTERHARARSFNPLELVRRALAEEGLIGVKVYPPMGFKPAGNEAEKCQTYHKQIVSDLAPGAPDDPATKECKERPANGSRAVGRMLDSALDRVFDLCLKHDGCVLAHANNSNDAGPAYATRADPFYWVGVFRSKPALRVGLGHFGHFAHASAGAPQASRLPVSSWEWALGRYIKQAGDPPVFADISYMTEALELEDVEAERYIKVLRSWIDEFDPECRHLMFGTDWTMLGIHPSYETYTKSIYEFFKTRCGFGDAMMERLFFGNASRFIGLRTGDRARARLLEFYARHGVPASRLPRFD